jgi:hypothetical protein
MGTTYHSTNAAGAVGFGFDVVLVVVVVVAVRDKAQASTKPLEQVVVRVVGDVPALHVVVVVAVVAIGDVGVPGRLVMAHERREMGKHSSRDLLLESRQSL